MTWLKENWFKVAIPTTVILACIILGGSIYAIQVNKQRSIEKQQQIELQAKTEQDKIKTEQDKKEYAANRKNDCLAIYKTERDKWNNVRGWRYSETDDQCFIRYKDPNPKTDAKSEELYKDATGFYLIMQKLLCKEGEFENSF